jgi:hypothetical protein
LSSAPMRTGISTLASRPMLVEENVSVIRGRTSS